MDRTWDAIPVKKDKFYFFFVNFFSCVNTKTMEKNLLTIALFKLKDQIPIDLQWNLVDPALKQSHASPLSVTNSNHAFYFFLLSGIDSR